jgi:hypothetical protein
MKCIVTACLILVLGANIAGAQVQQQAQTEIQSQTEYWDYGSWHVTVQSVDTGEDWRVTCTAHTGGDGDPTAALEITNADVGPPAYYPELTIREHAPRGYPTAIQDGQIAYVWFDDEDVYDGVTAAFTDDEGFQQARMTFPQDLSEWLVKAMRKNGQMDVVLDGKVLHSFWLDGFTASYLKIMEACGQT